MGWKQGILGVTCPAVAVMTLALAAALHPRLQGVLMTIGGLGFFIVAMIFAPRMKSLRAAAAWAKQLGDQTRNMGDAGPSAPPSPSV